MRRAIIDIGTNTAHLLIAEINKTNEEWFQVIKKKRIYTYLGSFGLDEIHPEPLSRLRRGLAEFDVLVTDHDVDDVIVLATEAMRTASNGPTILQSITDTYSWSPQIIDGLTEARLIATGAMHAVDMTNGDYLVMDIGGGSVEFIHVQNGSIQSLISTPLGISRLYDRFHTVDPINASGKNYLKKAVHEELSKLSITGVKDLTLVGTAGSFEMFLDKEEIVDNDLLFKNLSAQIITAEAERVAKLGLVERQHDPMIEDGRVKYIVVAFLLMEAVIDFFDIREVTISKYAMKEGAAINPI
ncbi:MAG: hypothetical protein AAFR14_02380 [Bacteroidota bacterium]